MIKNIFVKDAIISLVWLFSLIFIRYFTPQVFGDIIFYILLIYIYFTKNDHLWFPLILLLVASPGYLFNIHTSHALPGIGVTAEKGIYYEELVTMIYILKGIFNYRKTKLFYNNGLLFLVLWNIILWGIGLIYGIKGTTIFNAIRHLLPISIFWIIPILINDRQKVYQMINMIFVFSIFCFIAQLVDVLIGMPLAVLFGETKLLLAFYGKEVEVGSQKLYDASEEAIRSIYGVFFILISFVTSLYLFLSKHSVFKKHYLIAIFLLTYFSVFLSATRGWILSFTFVVLGTFLINSKLSKILMLGFLLTLPTIFISDSIRLQVVNVWERLSTLESLAEGDLSAGGTLLRLTERGPRVMNKFAESPILGFGYSNEFYNFYDGHVGNQNVLLHSGIFGYSLYVLLILALLLYIYQKGKFLDKALWVFGFGIIALIIIHSSSRQIFSYYFNFETATGLSMLLYITGFFIHEKELLKDNIVK